MQAAAQLKEDETQAVLAARKDILALLARILAERQSIVQVRMESSQPTAPFILLTRRV